MRSENPVCFARVMTLVSLICATSAFADDVTTDAAIDSTPAESAAPTTETPATDSPADSSAVTTDSGTTAEVTAETVAPPEEGAVAPETSPDSAPAATAAEAETVASPVAANPPPSTGELHGPYIGLATGTDSVGIAGVENGNATGLVIGYPIRSLAPFTLRGRSMATALSAEVVVTNSEYAVPSSPVADCLLENSTFAAYGVLRTDGRFYGKGRAGLLSESAKSSGNCTGISRSDFGFSAGIGAGVNLGKASFEVEYTLIEADINRLNLAILLHF